MITEKECRSLGGWLGEILKSHWLKPLNLGHIYHDLRDNSWSL